MQTPRPRYHHGALRETLLRASLQLIATEGIGAVSLRRVAREAGVSPAAPYHHFTDRAALLAALSAQGYQLLAEDLDTARSSARSPLQALSALIHAYVTFAQRQPAYFRLMFRPELSGSGNAPEARAAARYLSETVADCVREGIVAAEHADTLAMTAWSLAHGLASLCLDGQLRYSREEPGTLAERITALLESVLSTPRLLPCRAGDPRPASPADSRETG